MIEPIIDFKYPRLKDEFDRIDGRLQFILYAAAGYLYNKYRKKLLLTELERSQAMQDQYYGNNPDYKINPWKSVHQYGRGADASVLDLTEAEYLDLERYLNKHIVYDGTKVTVLVHKIEGGAIHFHIQVNYKGITELKG